jgi:hypothetical protein
MSLPLEAIVDVLFLAKSVDFAKGLATLAF